MTGGGLMRRGHLVQIVAISLGALVIGACARTVGVPRKGGADRPAAQARSNCGVRFAVSEAEMRENREGERPREIDRQVAGALAEELVRGLGDLGFTVERKPRGAGMAAGSAAAGAVKEYHSELERMAARSGHQAVAYLSEFFAKEGWIRPDQVKKATIR